jgi:glycosyltransferase involved in cell wall biosynthesis
MNIVHVIPAFTKGGAERVAVELANAAVRQGHAVAIVAAFHVPEDQLLCDLREDVEVRYVARTARSTCEAYRHLLPWLVRNRRWLLSRDIVHCHLTFGSLIGALLSAVRAVGGRKRPKVVETYHAVGAPLPPMVRRFHMALAATRDGLVTMAEDEHWLGFARDHPKVRSAMIPNGIALDIAPPAPEESDAYRTEAGIQPNALVMGSVGRLVPERRPEMLMRVFQHAAGSIPDLHFLMAGSGPESDRIRIMAEEAGLSDRVHLPGLVMRPALPFSIIDLYLTLNIGAITGIAGLEAAALGVPVIAFQGNHSFQPGPRDWIYSSSNPEELATEAIRLLRSVEARRTLAVQQEQYVFANHGAEAMVRDYLAFYEDVIAR